MQRRRIISSISNRSRRRPSLERPRWATRAVVIRDQRDRTRPIRCERRCSGTRFTASTSISRRRRMRRPLQIRQAPMPEPRLQTPAPCPRIGRHQRSARPRRRGRRRHPNPIRRGSPIISAAKRRSHIPLWLPGRRLTTTSPKHRRDGILRLSSSRSVSPPSRRRYCSRSEPETLRRAPRRRRFRRRRPPLFQARRSSAHPRRAARRPHPQIRPRGPARPCFRK